MFSKGADDYETLMPSPGSDSELTKPFPMEKMPLQFVNSDEIRESSKKKWMMREMKRAAANYQETYSISITLNER